ncbi:MAG: isoprenylcysteine carboxylmethyltransferase family protein [Anaerolineae bacterium]|nr:isoprenylcysteine carboxylmethyltransferase family protein [Anaerolineae bacterium]
MTETSERKPLAALLKRIGQLFFNVMVISVVLFVPARTLNWPRAWLFLAVVVVNLVISGVVLWRVSPEVVEARSRTERSVKTWDTILLAAYGLLSMVGAMVVAGLDHYHEWSDPPQAAITAGAVLMIVMGNALFLWAMVENAHFEKNVRIQDDRDHQVISTGPYRYVRHPGYVGLILQLLFTPLVLGSWWALIADGAAILLIVLRTVLEDRTLQRELPGYREFTQQTRFRLIPGLW